MSTKFDSPALVSQSNSYPPSWHGKVPARVRMDTTVESDMPWIYGKHYYAVVGVEYDAWVNSHGAVAVIFADGEMLGIKPYEFTVIAWHESGAHKERVMTYIKCYGCETMIDVPDELAGGLQGNHGDITSQMVEPYYCDSCERIALAAVAASMGDDYDDGGEYCLHCGKDIYDWSDLGCEYCDRRHPGFGTLD